MVPVLLGWAAGGDSHPPAAMFVLVVISVVLTVWWLGIEVAYVYLYHTLGLSLDVSLLFFTGSYDYFLLVNGFALYFVLDIVYNRLFGKQGGRSGGCSIHLQMVATRQNSICDRMTSAGIAEL